MVKMNVARRKVMRAIQTSARLDEQQQHEENRRTCAKVFALPKMLGRKSRSPAIMKSTPRSAGWRYRG